MRRTALAASALAALVALGVLVVISVAPGSGRKAAPGGLVSHFAVLRYRLGAQAPTDLMPSGGPPGLALDRSHAREVRVGSTTVWVVPGERGICFAALEPT